MGVRNTLSGVGQVIGDRLAVNKQQAEQKQEQGDIEAFMRQAMSGDPVAFKELMIKSPQAAQMVAQHIQSQQAGQQAEQDQFKSEMAIETAGFVEQMQLAPPEQQEAMFNSAVDDPRYDIDEEDRQHFMDPNARKALIAKVKGDDYAKNFFGGDFASDNKSLPAEAVAFNDLIKDFSPKEKQEARRVKAGLKGKAMSNALLTAIESGNIDKMKQAAADMKQAEKFGAMTGASRAKAIDKGIESIAKIDIGLGNINDAIQAVNDGAGTGAIEKKFPSLKAASIALDNIQGRMALDVVGAVTFGALSQGELDLAKSVALPTGLEAPELIKYLNDKKSAQQKLRDYYNEQIQFLDQGGTVAGFMRQKERGSTVDQNTNTTNNSNEISDAELLNKYGGQ